METQLLPAQDTQATPVAVGPTTITAIAAAGTTPATPPAPTGLPQTHHEAYRMKLAGQAMQEIADSFGVDRSTIWRWCKAVEGEAINQLANQPVFNILVEECARLTDLEEQARAGAANTTSDRAKSMFLAEARRAAVSRQNLLLAVGVLPKAPEQIYRITANMKPQEQAENDNPMLRNLTQDEVRAELEKRLSECRIIK